MTESNALSSISPEIFQRIRAEIPDWSSLDLAVSTICKNWGNDNYLVTAPDGNRWVMRISKGDTPELGIHRTAESKTAAAASRIGVGPELSAFLLPEGHQVTRFIDGEPPDAAWLSSDLGIVQVGTALRKLHAQPGNGQPHAPLETVRRCARLAKDLPQSQLLDDEISKFEHILELQRQSPVYAEALLHGDCYPNNMIRNAKRVWFIDFEFSSVGDPWYDLACLSFQLDDAGLQRLIQSYAGECTPEHLAAVHRNRYIACVWDAAWALLQLWRGRTEKDFAEHFRNTVSYLPALHAQALT